MGEYFSRPQNDGHHCHPVALVRIQSHASSLNAEEAEECNIKSYCNPERENGI